MYHLIIVFCFDETLNLNRLSGIVFHELLFSLHLFLSMFVFEAQLFYDQGMFMG